ncbi:MAG: hypothetical protein WDN24_22485 [Sphingomonas sp.]
MLVFAILLQTVPPETGEAPAMPRLTDPATEREMMREVMRERRFRLDVESVPVEDAKNRALRAVWRPCGLTGAPVCPSKGTFVVRRDDRSRPSNQFSPQAAGMNRASPGAEGLRCCCLR